MVNGIRIWLKRSRQERSRGYTLLEYCAGAAIICSIVWAALTVFGNGVGSFLTSVSDWLGRRGTSISG